MKTIRPGNILVDKRGRVKIADFGLAKLLGRTTTDYTLTGSGQVMGTPNGGAFAESQNRSCAAPIDEVTTRIESWLHRNGFATGDEYNWSVQTVPRGEKVGEVRLREAWKPSVFDRWSFGRHGLERVSPWLAFQLVASDKPVQTLVLVVSTGNGPVRRIPPGLISVLDSLAAKP